MDKVVEMLPGIRHYETAGFANTREAYDALTVEDGWEERQSEDTRWKLGTVNGRRFVVHTPSRLEGSHRG